MASSNMAAPAASNPSAVKRVFGIPELLHKILLCLSHDSGGFDFTHFRQPFDPSRLDLGSSLFERSPPPARPAFCDLYVLQRVNRLWKDTINQSTRLKQAMWLLPEPRNKNKDILNHKAYGHKISMAKYSRVYGAPSSYYMSLISECRQGGGVEGEETPVVFRFYPTPSHMHKKLRSDVRSRGHSTRSVIHETWSDMLIASVGTDNQSQAVTLQLCQPLSRGAGERSLGRLARSTLTCTMGEVHDWIQICHAVSGVW